MDALVQAVLGDPADAYLLKPCSYEDVHADVQSILLPPMLPKGVSVHVLQSLNKSFALMHKVALEPGAMQRTMFGPMPGPGNRLYSLGAIVTHKTPGGAKLRASGQYDPFAGFGKSTLLADVWGDGRWRLQGQLVDESKGAAPEWAVTSTVRGGDYVCVQRLKHGPEVGVSFNQRVYPSSPITVGGEVMVKTDVVRQALEAARSGGAAPKGKAVEWAVGAAYDTGLSKTALHMASTSAFAPVFSVHHLYRVTERSSIAAKFMLQARSYSSMAAIGYRMRFRNTLSTIHGMVDTYGSVRTVVEREPIPGVKISASMEARLGPNADRSSGEAASFGLKISVGAASPIVAPLSPVTMTRDIFSAA